MKRLIIVVFILFVAIITLISLSIYFPDNKSITYTLTIFGSLLSLILGSYLTLVKDILQKKEIYILNAQTVLLILGKQLNELINIKARFPETHEPEVRHLTIKRTLLNDSEWRLSKEQIIKLNSTKKEMINFVYELMFIDSYFKELFASINDYNKYKEPLELKYSQNLPISSNEDNQLKSYMEGIYNRLYKRDLELKSKNFIDQLHAFLTKEYPDSIFPKFSIENQ